MNMQQTAMAAGPRIRAIAGHLPAGTLDNAALSRRYPEWSPADILRKTGIATRAIAAPDECASDLAAVAARKLIDSGAVDPETVDLLVFCSQSPDHFLPTTACILQHRLGLPDRCMSFDLPLGCSGFVHGLAVVKGLLETGAARRALLLTGDTYSRFIHPEDRNVAAIFGDAGTATFIEAGREGEKGSIGLGPFVFGSDGSGAGDLIVRGGACREPATPPRLYMDGPKIFEFCLKRIPELVQELCSVAGLGLGDVDLWVFHQANRFMLERLRNRLGIAPERFSWHLEEIGNTVSSTIPLALEAEQVNGRLRPGMKVGIVGFGVGYSWGAGLINWN